jgi:hypothetical protein
LTAWWLPPSPCAPTKGTETRRGHTLEARSCGIDLDLHTREKNPNY